MAWGILEVASRTGDYVPGTVLLEERSDNIGAVNTERLRKVVRKNEAVILVPQPSDDPNDPLNLSLLQRDLWFLLFGYCGILIVGGSVVPCPCPFYRRSLKLTSS